MLGSRLMNCFDRVKHTMSTPGNETLGRKYHITRTIAAHRHCGPQNTVTSEQSLHEQWRGR